MRANDFPATAETNVLTAALNEDDDDLAERLKDFLWFELRTLEDACFFVNAAIKNERRRRYEEGQS